MGYNRTKRTKTLQVFNFDFFDFTVNFNEMVQIAELIIGKNICDALIEPRMLIRVFAR